MKTRTKKVLKIIGLAAGVIVIAVAGLGIYHWDTISIMMINAEIEGAIGGIPEPVKGSLPPVTEGENDWVCWRGTGNDARSKMAGIITDWQKGLKKKWEIDYLCQGKQSATWSAPVIKGNRLVVTGRDENNDIVFCLNPDNGSMP